MRQCLFWGLGHRMLLSHFLTVSLSHSTRAGEANHER